MNLGLNLYVMNSGAPPAKSPLCLLQIAWLKYHGCPLQCAEGTSIASSKVQLGPLYARSQGQCSTQIQHSYWCKSWNQPQGLYTRSQDWNRKKLFNRAQVLINAKLYGLVLAPRLKKRYHHIWEANLQPLGPIFQHLLISWRNVLAVIRNLGPICNPKMFKLAPSFFDPDS
jgi:hypothetical protein